MKKILVLGVGAQGSAAAKRLDLEPNVGEIICADQDMKAVDSVVSSLTKARGMKVDAHDKASIVAAAQGVDLILNGLPLECTENVLDAALEVKADYQDYAATINLFEKWRNSPLASEDDDGLADYVTSEETVEWIESLKALYRIYGPEFKKIGKLAVIGTGSAPGLICCAARRAVRELDTCDTIYNIVWEGTYAKRFQPFWWSPVTALSDMSEQSLAFENGRFVNRPPFSTPIKRRYDYMDEEVTFLEHSHDEPIHYGFNAAAHFKGCRNVFFKYAGAGMDFAKPLYQAGLLSRDEEEFDGKKIVPFDFILKHIPPAPKYREEIHDIVMEGLAKDAGCMVVEAYGKKNGKDVLVETHVFAPGFIESYARAEITSEMYLTGQGGFFFSKMFINDKFDQTGLISSDMLTDEQIDTYFGYAAELGITLDIKIKPL